MKERMKNTYLTMDEVQKNFKKTQMLNFLDKQEGYSDELLFKLVETLVGRNMPLILEKLKSKYNGIKIFTTKKHTFINGHFHHTDKRNRFDHSCEKIYDWTDLRMKDEEVIECEKEIEITDAPDIDIDELGDYNNV